MSNGVDGGEKPQPTYQSLFGASEYYTVPPGRSVISPAAYFVDLMNLVNASITDSSSDTLGDRRPDLANNLILDNLNTYTEIPKLQIVNQVLQTAQGCSANDLSTAIYPFNLPYDQYLMQTRVCLAQAKTSLPAIWQELRPTDSPCNAAIQREQAGLSSVQWTQFTTPFTTASALLPYYGSPAGGLSSLANVSTFLTQTGLSQDELRQLVYEDLSPLEVQLGVNSGFFINTGSAAPIGIAGGALQNLQLSGNDVTRLDPLQRFVRLAQALGWSFTDLDWALRTIASSTGLWMGMGSGLYISNDGNTPTPITLPSIPTGTTINFIEYFGGLVYVGTTNGLYSIAGSKGNAWVPHFGQSTAGTPISVTCLVAHLGNLYAGTSESGLYSCGSGTWGQNKSVSTTSTVKCLKILGSCLYAFTGNGLYALSGGTWNALFGQSTSSGGTAISVDCIADFDGSLYAGTCNNGVYSNNGGTWDPVSGDAPAASTVNCLYAFDGSLYAGTSNGLYSLSKGAWKPLFGQLQNPGAPISINCLADFGGSLYAGTSNGLYSPSNGEWLPLFGEQKMPGTAISVACLTGLGDSLYAGTDSGLYSNSNNWTGAIYLGSTSTSITCMTAAWTVGSPAIDATVLPTLAWMQTLRTRHGLSVNQCCALIGTLKDFGLANGPSFFEQIFTGDSSNAPALAWAATDPAAAQPAIVWSSNPTWNVPSIGSSSADSADRQIQSALTAALRISRDDVVMLGNLILGSSNGGALKLTPQTLGLLYRFSLLPTLTGLSLKQTLAVANLIGQTQYLTCTTATAVQSAIAELTRVCDWLNGSGLSTWQLQFVLAGESSDPKVQNNILGLNAIENFLKDLKSSIHPITLTEERFVAAVESDLYQAVASVLPHGRSSNATHVVRTIGQSIYTRLVSCHQIDASGGLVAPSLTWSDAISPLPVVTTTAYKCSSVSPALVSFGSNLYIAWADENSCVNIASVSLSTDGSVPDIGTVLTASPQSATAPALASRGNQLYIAWTDNKSCLNIAPVSVSKDGSVSRVGTVLTASQQSATAPALASLGSVLYIAWTGEDNLLNIAHVPVSKDGSVSRVGTVLTSSQTSATAPALSSFGSNLSIAWTDESGCLNFASVSRSKDGSVTGVCNVLTTAEASSAAPAFASFQGSEYLAWADGGGSLNIVQAPPWLDLSSANTSAFGIIDPAIIAEVWAALVICSSDIVETISATLTRYEGLQQQTLAHHLASLNGVSGPLGAALTAFADDNLCSLLLAVPLSTGALGATQIEASGFPTNDAIVCIEGSNGVVYVGTASNGLWSSNDGGQTWTQTTLPAPGGGSAPAYISCIRRVADAIFVGTNLGLWRLGKAAPYASTLEALLLSPEGSSVPATLLRGIQQFAALITAQSLSASEVTYAQTAGDIGLAYPITLPMVQSLGNFKQLVTDFGDSQNNLIAFLTSQSPPSSTPYDALAALGGWHANAVETLLTNDTAAFNPTITSGDVARIKAYFDTADLLGVDVSGVLDLVQLATDVPSPLLMKDVAQALWGGLQFRNSSQPAVVSAIQARLSEALRDHLVPLAIQSLGTALNTPTARGLYEYFLIDVEVSGKIMTSPVMEATSALQLYIYRCLNNLEPKVTVLPGLSSVWSWMSTYRVWQANKEVLLYPEDYMLPELRKDATDLFAAAQSALQQADLTNPDNLTGTFQEYMNGLAEVGGLSVVGSAVCDQTVDGIAAKQLCLLAMTAEAPMQFYWRIATFIDADGTGHYVPSDWGQWQKMSLKIQPVQDPDGNTGAVTPVFAFGAWYVFWVEQAQTGTLNANSVSQGSPLYTATIAYSHLDFSGRWVAAQTLASIDLGPTPIQAAGPGNYAASPPSPGGTVHAVYFSSLQALFVPYVEAVTSTSGSPPTTTTTFAPIVYPLSSNPLAGSVCAVSRFGSTTVPPVSADLSANIYSPTSTSNSLQFQYYAAPGSQSATDVKSLATWFMIPAGVTSAIPFWDGLTVQVGQPFPGTTTTISADTWYHYASSGGSQYLNGNDNSVAGSLYVGTSGSGLHQYNPASTTQWSQFNSSNTFSNEPPNNSDVNVLYAFEGSLYVGTVDSGLYQYTPASQAWSQVNFSNPSSNAPSTTSAVSVLYAFEGSLYVGTAGSGLYQYTPASQAWSQVNSSNTFTNEPLNNSLVSVLYAFAGNLYVGTLGSGLYQYTPASQAWSQVNSSNTFYNEPPNNSHVSVLYAFAGNLFAGTKTDIWDELSDGLYQYNPSGGWIQVAAPGSPSIRSDVRVLYAFEGSIYVGTAASGLYQGKAASQTWSQVNSLNVTALLDEFTVNQSTCPPFAGVAQETLYFDTPLTSTQVAALYNNSKAVITQAFDIAPPGLSGLSADAFHYVIGQPNWTLLDSANAQYLTAPSAGGAAFDCYRLNSTAIGTLGALLNQPAGINALLSVAAQQTSEYPFEVLNAPAALVPNPPSDQIDFTDQSAMSPYFWEVFFHLPFLIARELGLQQQFQGAKNWFEYVFDPTGNTALTTNTPVLDDYWCFLGLNPAVNPTLQLELDESSLQEAWADFTDPAQVYESDTDPFDPFAIANLRPIAYQKVIVAQYIANLLAWGDMLYTQNTRETITEAEMLYVMCYDLLGQEPNNLGLQTLQEACAYGSVGSVTLVSSGPPNITCFCEFSGLLYAGTTNWLYSSNDGQTWNQVESGSNQSTIGVLCLYVYDNTLYVGTNDNGLYSSIDGKSWNQITSNSFPTTSSVNCLFALDDALYAVTIASWIYFCVGGSNSAWSQADSGDVDYSISCVYVGQAGVFAGTSSLLPGTTPPPQVDGSIYQFQNGQWSNQQPLNAAVNCIYEVDGSLYAGTTNGLYVLSSGTWTPIASFPSPAVTSPEVNCLLALNQTIYAGTSQGIYCSRRGNNWIQIAAVSSANCLFAFEGSLYIGGSGLWVQPTYFGIPRNRQFLSDWDTVKQRIYNIRHGLTIDGQSDALPLFQPPINPMALVAAVASGESVAQTLSSASTTIPNYRFSVMIEKAKAIVETVIALGQSLLSVLQTKDAEALAMLYVTNRQAMLTLAVTAGQDDVNAAQQDVQALQTSLASAQYRENHYNSLINAGLSAREEASLRLAISAIAVQAVSEPLKTLAIPAYVVPNVFGLADGGMKFGDAVNQGAAILEGVGNLLNQGSSLASTNASYQRRAEDWQLQAALAQDDVSQIQQQILAAQYRQDRAAQGLAQLQQEITQEATIANFYQSRFTNRQLYQWYIGQVSSVYFQTYQLALDVALEAQNAWQFEQIGFPVSSGVLSSGASGQFVRPGYWNTLYQGLFAGEALRLDLQRMEQAYVNQNVRALEIRKTVSLAQLDPIALLQLKTTGTCTFDLLERDFDFDFPGHFCRKIKSVSISLPVTLGPYQDVHGTLTQLSSKIVTADSQAGQDAVSYLLTGQGTGGAALVTNQRPRQQVALSRGIDDAGLFQLDFGDPRYLPFEGTGAVSTWQLDLPLLENAFDFAGLADVILHMQYTAFPGNSNFRACVVANRGPFAGSRVYSLAQELAPAWQQFVKSGELSFTVTPGRWRLNTGSSQFTITGVTLWAMQSSSPTQMPTLDLAIPTSASNSVQLSAWTEPGTVMQCSVSPQDLTISAGLQTWSVSVASVLQLPSALSDLVLIVTYSAG